MNEQLLESQYGGERILPKTRFEPAYACSTKKNSDVKSLLCATGIAVIAVHGTNIGFPNYTLEPTSGADRLLQSYAAITKTRAKQDKNIKQQLSDIKYYFGISISDLANVLHVQRPAIYEWLEGVNPREDNRERILNIYRYAQFWKSQSNAPIKKHIREPMEDGKSLFELLSSEIFDDIKVKDAMLNVAARITQAETEKATEDKDIHNNAFEALSISVTHID